MKAYNERLYFKRLLFFRLNLFIQTIEKLVDWNGGFSPPTLRKSSIPERKATNLLLFKQQKIFQNKKRSGDK